MSMQEAIENFSTQLSYEPEIKNPKKLKKAENIIVCGMGGSHLAADLLKIALPTHSIFVHHDYGLPELPKKILDKSLVIMSSYSGNTEETISSLEEAKKRKLPIAIITVGGALLEFAIKHDIAYVEMPNTGIQPRSALGFSMKAILALIGQIKLNAEIKKLSESFLPKHFEHLGKALAEKLEGFVPVIYASFKNAALAYVWKIKFNETGKIPAFYNIFSELNHNEMTGFDIKEKTKSLSSKFHFLLIEDPCDDIRIQKRMRILKKLYEERSLPVSILRLSGERPIEKIFSSIILADWASFYTAKQYGADPEQVPMVEEFKKLVA